MLKLKKLAAIMLVAATVTTSTVSFSNVQAFAKTKKETKAKKDEKVKTYGSTYALEESEKGMKLVAKANFFEDPNDDSLTVFLSTDGSFINSKLIQSGDYYNGRMLWPSAYECSIEVRDEENSGGMTKIVSSAPTNSISASEVSNTMGYSVGGSVGVEGGSEGGKGSASVNGSYSYSQAVSYTQPHFTTILDENNLSKASWKVEFSSTPDGYDRASKNITYGNQMFMISRLNNPANENITKKDKLSTLISGGFSPNFLVALKAPKGKKESIVTVGLGRSMDKYILEWSGFNWFGYNFSNDKSNMYQSFLIDWKDHTIKPIETIEPPRCLS
ncbi:MAG: leukocidin family pore-forming toxin [Sarcina sp.]